MEAIKAEYNTGRNKMIISEYGRNIQKMIEYAVAEGDRDKRNKLAQALIALMGTMNPHLRDVADYKHKLWDHLFVMSDFKLDVDSPYPTPNPETLFSKPQSMAYPQKRIRFKFYGKNIEQMIQQAADMEDGPTKSGFINIIGSFMKNACKNWNEEMLADEEILAHLEMLSGGRIKMSEDADVQFNALQQQGTYYHKRPDNRGGQQNRNKQGGNNRNFRNNNNGGGGNNRNNRNFRNNNNRNRPTN